MKIYEKISVFRQMKGLTQEELAYKIGITQGAYSQLECGRTKITYETVEKLAEALDVSIIDLIAYPKVYIEKTADTITMEGVPSQSKDEIKAVLQLELKKDTKDQVLKMIFGDNIEILNK